MLGYRNGINLDELDSSELRDNTTNNEFFDAEDIDENFTESFMDEGLFVANGSLDTQSLQEQFELQKQEQLRTQQEIEFENHLLAENLTNDTNEQVAEWRRELEQRLMDDNNSKDQNGHESNTDGVDEIDLTALDKELNNNDESGADYHNNSDLTKDKKSIDLNKEEKYNNDSININYENSEN